MFIDRLPFPTFSDRPTLSLTVNSWQKVSDVAYFGMNKTLNLTCFSVGAGPGIPELSLTLNGEVLNQEALYIYTSENTYNSEVSLSFLPRDDDIVSCDCKQFEGQVETTTDLRLLRYGR